MKVYQVKEITEYTKQVTEAVNKKFPGSNITEHMTREVLNIFQHNLRDQIIILNQHPATGKSRAWNGSEFEVSEYHISLICITPGYNKRTDHANILLQIFPSKHKDNTNN